MLKTIRIRRDRLEIGFIVFDLQSKKSAMGEVQMIDIQTDPALETRIKEILENNPEALVIGGGYSPGVLGNYGDGIRVTLESLTEEFNFTFDSSEIPLPKFSADVRVAS